MGEGSEGFMDRVRSNIPEGEKAEDGFCFRDALNKAGYDIDLPPWVHVDDVPIVCDELQLDYLTGQGRNVSLGKNDHLIVGYVVQDRGPDQDRIGHWEYTENGKELFQRVDQRNVFSIIRVSQ